MTTVTWWTKLIALAMYIVLPFLGFYLGFEYQEKRSGYLDEHLIGKCPANRLAESTSSSGEREYMVVNGEMVEFEEIDLQWVRDCDN